MLRPRLPASVVTLLTAAYLISSIGCTTGAYRQAIAPGGNSQTSAVTLPSDAALAAEHSANSQTHVTRLPAVGVGDVQMASYQTGAPGWDAHITGTDYDNVNVNVDDVVRGQGYESGPLKILFMIPYVIGTAIIAGIVVPLAVEHRETPVGGP